MKEDIKILVAAHKAYPMPADAMYLPVHVGAAGKEPIGFQPDNTGENISEKNPVYCELTGLYWAWKNVDCDYLGLTHYRRHFTTKNRGFLRKHAPMEAVLTKEELLFLLSQYPILVPKKRRYYIETLYSHYAHTHEAAHLAQTRAILEALHPADVAAFDRVLQQRAGHMFNMYIMKKSLSDAYCAWLFPVLEALEQKVDTTGYSAFEKRYAGRISELLFNVWLAGRAEPMGELGYLPMEGEPWLKKGVAFLKAKCGKKYAGSF